MSDEIICELLIIYCNCLNFKNFRNVCRCKCLLLCFCIFIFFLLKSLLLVYHSMLNRTRNRICFCIHSWGISSVRSTLTINVHLSFKSISHNSYNKKFNGTFWISLLFHDAQLNHISQSPCIWVESCDWLQPMKCG